MHLVIFLHKMTKKDKRKEKMEGLKYVFISHKNVQPDQGITERLSEYLSNQKLAWWYDFGMRAGNWDEQISKKLRGATAYVIIASKASLNNDSVQVLKEVSMMDQEVQSNKKIIIPFVIDDYYFKMEPGGADYHLGGNRYQAVVLSKFPDEESAFHKLADYLKDVLEVFENNPKDFVIENNVLKKYLGKDCVVAVPRSIEEIADGAFCFNEYVEKVKIPESVKIICKRAFFACKNLASVGGMSGVEICDPTAFDQTPINVPEEDKFMLNGVVFRCPLSEDKKLVIPQGAKVIASRAFSCTDAEEIIFPEGLEHIGIRAFVDCCDIKEVNFPKSLKSIGLKAFDGCYALEKAVFAGDIPAGAFEAFNKKVQLIGGNK